MIDLLDNPTQLDTATELVFPDTWRRESGARYQQWADEGRVTQADVDEIENVLVWFRNVRDEYARQRLNGDRL